MVSAGAWEGNCNLTNWLPNNQLPHIGGCCLPNLFSPLALPNTLWLLEGGCGSSVELTAQIVSLKSIGHANLSYAVLSSGKKCIQLEMPQQTIKKKLGIYNLSFFSRPSFHIIIAFCLCIQLNLFKPPGFKDLKFSRAACTYKLILLKRVQNYFKQCIRIKNIGAFVRGWKKATMAGRDHFKSWSWTATEWQRLKWGRLQCIYAAKKAIQ